MEAFKATLEEAVLADFLIHVMDATSPEVDRFHDTTLEVLGELGAEDKEIITVLNKIDLVSDPDVLAALDRRYPDALRLSAVTAFGWRSFSSPAGSAGGPGAMPGLSFSPASRRLVSLLRREAEVLSTAYEADDTLVRAVVPATIAGRIRQFADLRTDFLKSNDSIHNRCFSIRAAVGRGPATCFPATRIQVLPRGLRCSRPCRLVVTKAPSSHRRPVEPAAPPPPPEKPEKTTPIAPAAQPDKPIGCRTHG